MFMKRLKKRNLFYYDPANRLQDNFMLLNQHYTMEADNLFYSVALFIHGFLRQCMTILTGNITHLYNIRQCSLRQKPNKGLLCSNKQVQSTSYKSP